MGILLLIGCPVLTVMIGHPQSLLGTILSWGMLLGLILWIVGLCYYAAAKGYSAALGTLGILTVIGLLILLALPDKTKK